MGDRALRHRSGQARRGLEDRPGSTPLNSNGYCNTSGAYKQIRPSQHVVHMGRVGGDGILSDALLDVPTAKVDMSFFTSP
jgi:hypothetical protein